MADFFNLLRIDDQLLELRGHLGSGTYGKQQLAYHKDKHTYHVVQHLHQGKNTQDMTEEEFRSLEAELHQLSGIKHKNLLSIAGVIHGGFCTIKATVLPYLRHGSIKNLLLAGNHGDCIPLTLVMRWMEEAAQAMYHLHSINPDPILHGCLSPNNVLINNKLHALVTDFGMFRILPINDSSPKPTAAADIYSYGATLKEVTASYSQMTRKSSGTFSQHVPMTYWTVRSKAVKNCMDSDENKRPSFQHLLHEYFSRIQWDTQEENKLRMDLYEILGYPQATNQLLMRKYGRERSVDEDNENRISLEVKEQLKQLNTEINQTSLELQAQTIKIKSDDKETIDGRQLLGQMNIHLEEMKHQMQKTLTLLEFTQQTGRRKSAGQMPHRLSGEPTRKTSTSVVSSNLTMPEAEASQLKPTSPGTEWQHMKVVSEPKLCGEPRKSHNTTQQSPETTKSTVTCSTIVEKSPEILRSPVVATACQARVPTHTENITTKIRGKHCFKPVGQANIPLETITLSKSSPLKAVTRFVPKHATGKVTGLVSINDLLFLIQCNHNTVYVYNKGRLVTTHTVASLVNPNDMTTIVNEGYTNLLISDEKDAQVKSNGTVHWLPIVVQGKTCHLIDRKHVQLDYTPCGLDTDADTLRFVVADGNASKLNVYDNMGHLVHTISLSHVTPHNVIARKGVYVITDDENNQLVWTKDDGTVIKRLSINMKTVIKPYGVVQDGHGRMLVFGEEDDHFTLLSGGNTQLYKLIHRGDLSCISKMTVGRGGESLKWLTIACGDPPVVVTVDYKAMLTNMTK